MKVSISHYNILERVGSLIVKSHVHCAWIKYILQIVLKWIWTFTFVYNTKIQPQGDFFKNDLKIG